MAKLILIVLVNGFKNSFCQIMKNFQCQVHLKLLQIFNFLLKLLNARFKICSVYIYKKVLHKILICIVFSSDRLFQNSPARFHWLERSFRRTESETLSWTIQASHAALKSLMKISLCFLC